MSLITIGQSPGTSGGLDEDFIFTSSRNYLAYFEPGDDEFTVLSGCGFAINTPHPSYSRAIITDIKAELLEPIVTNPETNTACSQWKITLEYGPWDPLTHSVNGNPVSMPTRFRVDFTTAEVAAFVDVDGDPIVNSAGDPYDPPLLRKVNRATLYVDRNESAATVNMNTLLQLSDTVNVAVWNGFPAKTVYLNPVKLPAVEYSQVTGQFYFPMSYVFDINFDTWVTQVVNAGLRQLDSEGNLIPILVNGQPVSTPVPLDESGHAILNPEYLDPGGDIPPDTNPDGSPGEDPGGGEPPEGGTGETGGNLVIDAYDLIRAADFSALNMDGLFTLP